MAEQFDDKSASGDVFDFSQKAGAPPKSAVRRHVQHTLAKVVILVLICASLVYGAWVVVQRLGHGPRGDAAQASAIIMQAGAQVNSVVWWK